MSSIPLAYEYERDDFYCYPDSSILKNKLNIRDEAKLALAEREITLVKMTELVEKPLGGKLNFEYVKSIHKYLFEDVYDWAGEIRTVDISKGIIFCQHELIEVNANFLFEELENENYLMGLSKQKLIERLAYYMGDLNSIHPFREGNGRVQRIFIRELASRNGFYLNLDNITPLEMIKACNAAFEHDYGPLSRVIEKSLRKL